MPSDSSAIRLLTALAKSLAKASCRSADGGGDDGWLGAAAFAGAVSETSDFRFRREGFALGTSAPGVRVAASAAGFSGNVFGAVFSGAAEPAFETAAPPDFSAFCKAASGCAAGFAALPGD